MKVVEVHFKDDIDHSLEANTTITIGIDIDYYELDLNKINDEKLRRLLQPWIDKGRKVNSPHIPLPTSGDRDKIDLKMRKREQWLRIYYWALDITDLADGLPPRKTSNHFPWIKRYIKDDYFESHPDDPEIK